MPETKKFSTARSIILLLATFLLVLLVITGVSLLRKGSHRIISAYEGQAKYIAAVQADSAADKAALYQKYVSDVYEEACGGGGLISVNPMRQVESFETEYPLGNLEVLAEQVNIIRDSNAKQVAEQALEKSWKELPGSKVTGCIFALDPFQESPILFFMHGLYGTTYGPGSFLIEILPKEGWLDWLPYTIAHEYHHTIYFQDYYQSSSTQFDLLELLIAEGRADAFARTLYPDMEAPWTKALKAEQEMVQWQLIQNELDSTTNLGRFMFGDNQIPWWTGYTIGYHIVQKYLASHPGISVEEWTKKDAHSVLEESGYAGQP